MSNIQSFYIENVLGWFEITASPTHLLSVKRVRESKESSPDAGPVLKEAVRQLEEYFEGKRKTFDLPIWQDGSPFQEKIWEELQKIPFGKYVSYKELADMAGYPEYSHAIESATGKNQICIVVPCHRVVQSEESIGSYAYGIDMKRTLLFMESLLYQKVK